jgi:hypothetical protein
VKRVATAGPEEPLLAKETAIFSALMYKNNNQHRRTLSFKHLRQVCNPLSHLSMAHQLLLCISP